MPEQLAGVTATVVDNNVGIGPKTAGRIVGEGIKFVATAAQFPTAPITPSRVVDEGWHALILHTALYAKARELHQTGEKSQVARSERGVNGSSRYYELAS